MRLLRGVGNVFVAAIVAFGSVALAPPAWSQPAVEVVGGSAGEALVSDDGQVTHNASGFVYPMQLGDMPLRKVKVYGKADASADYSLRGGGNGDAWITFFVYPASGSLQDEVAGVEQALVQNMSASPVSPPAAQPTSLADGRSGWFRGTYQGISLTTGYMIVQRGDWLLKARFTIPDEAGRSGIDRTVTALAAVPWDWKPSKKARADDQLAQRR